MEQVLHKNVDKLVDMVKHNRLLKLTRFEKVTILVLGIILFTLASASIYTKSTVSELNAVIQKTEVETEAIRVDNQIYEQKIEDLMTYDRITEVATRYGMVRRDNNIKAVNK